MSHSFSFKRLSRFASPAAALIFASVLSPVLAQTSTPIPVTPTVSTTTCPGAPTSRLSINRFATVAPDIFDNLRSTPSIKGQILDKVLADTQIGIEAGPTCADNYAWWQVNYNGQDGWVAEGDSKLYYLIPSTSPVNEYTMPATDSPIAVSYGGVSLVYNGAFGNKVQADTINPVTADPNNPFSYAAPAYPNFQFYFDPNSALYEAGMSVIPVAGLIAANPDAKTAIDQLKTITSTPQTDQTLGQDTPILPPVNAGQVFHSNVHNLKAAGINGVRFLTMFAQDVSPVTNDHLRYVFEGFTSDGKYFIRADFPVTASILPADFNAATDFNAILQSANTDQTAITKYYDQQAAKLSAADPSVFKPSLENVDAIIMSIVVKP